MFGKSQSVLYTDIKRQYFSIFLVVATSLMSILAFVFVLALYDTNWKSSWTVVCTDCVTCKILADSSSRSGNRWMTGNTTAVPLYHSFLHRGICLQTSGVPLQHIESVPQSNWYWQIGTHSRYRRVPHLRFSIYRHKCISTFMHLCFSFPVRQPDFQSIQ